MVRATGLGEQDVAATLRQLTTYGFESFELDFWQTAGEIDLLRLADLVREALGDSGAVISCLGIYGNPLGNQPEDEATRVGLRTCIEAAPRFDCDLVTCWAGRIRDTPIPENIPVFRRTFAPLVELASGIGVRIGFENWGDGWNSGNWNIAHCPEAWELIFDALPGTNVGLEWEPCHPLMKLIDPLPQLRNWAHRVFHVHGKDATVRTDLNPENKNGGAVKTARLPGFGDSDWTQIIAELIRAEFNGSIDIEGWHDPVYRDDREMIGQAMALKYLKSCREAAVQETSHSATLPSGARP
jgi:sugar phosphate isomerase/epimerase